MLRTERPLHIRRAQRFLVAIALLFGVPSGLAAQGAGQTPENAQAFLTKVFAAGGVEVTAKSDPNLDYGWTHTILGNSTASFPMARAMSWKHMPDNSGSFCQSQIGVFGIYGTRRDNRYGGTTLVPNSIWSFFRPTDPVAGEYNENAYLNGSGNLAWSQVSAVQVDHAVVTLPITYAGGGIRFQFPTADVAKRAGFAMEVIRLACDATADENF